jgi:hypothetical protein
VETFVAEEVSGKVSAAALQPNLHVIVSLQKTAQAQGDAHPHEPVRLDDPAELSPPRHLHRPVRGEGGRLHGEERAGHHQQPDVRSCRSSSRGHEGHRQHGKVDCISAWVVGLTPEQKARWAFSCVGSFFGTLFFPTKLAHFDYLFLPFKDLYIRLQHYFFGSAI